MKKFKFVEPTKIKVRYPDIQSVYKDEGNLGNLNTDFFSYENGAIVEEYKVQEWVNECIQGLLNNPENPYYYINGGNTLVVAMRNLEEINVFVSKSHMQATIPLYEYTYGEEETL